MCGLSPPALQGDKDVFQRALSSQSGSAFASRRAAAASRGKPLALPTVPPSLCVEVARGLVWFVMELLEEHNWDFIPVTCKVNFSINYIRYMCVQGIV